MWGEVPLPVTTSGRNFGISRFRDPGTLKHCYHVISYFTATPNIESIDLILWCVLLYCVVTSRELSRRRTSTYLVIS
jgi:hypothetical protein